MSFTSFTFILFTAVLVAAYYLLPKRVQWVLLLAASYVFYAFFSLKATVFILLTTFVTFAGGYTLARLQNAQKEALAAGGESGAVKRRYKKSARLVLAAALVLVFGILVLLKYYNFLAQNIDALTGLVGLAPLPSLQLLLPLGISFYIFQSAGYLIDVYRGKYRAERNLFKLALFVSFFPQLIQGPIGRYDKLAPQLYAERSFDGMKLKHGILLMLWGFFKKMLIADRLAGLVSTVFGHYNEYGGAVIFIGVVGYCFQIYCDFSGGIDIARGCAQLFGIHMDKNFARPYFAGSVSEFWRRWHITLGSWMRDYVFYPLSLSKAFSKLGKPARKLFGSRIGKILPATLATFIVFALIGAWHGASWKYIAFGFYNGIIITFSTLCAPLYAKLHGFFKTNPKSRGWRVFSILRTFFLMAIGRFFSRGDRLLSAFAMIGITFTHPRLHELYDGTLLRLSVSAADYLVVGLSLLVVFAVSVLQERGIEIRKHLESKPAFVQTAVLFVLLAALILFGVYREGYVATQFIYAQF